MRPAGSAYAQSPISFHEAVHRFAGAKGMSLGSAARQLGGRPSTIGATAPESFGGIKAPSGGIKSGIFRAPKV